MDGQHQGMDGVKEVRRYVLQHEGVPVQLLPFPVYPVRHVHLKEPMVFSHSVSHTDGDCWHSLISGRHQNNSFTLVRHQIAP